MFSNGHGTHVAVLVYSFKGDRDDTLKFPVRFTITLELLNQHRDQDHYRRDIQCEMVKGANSTICYNKKWIPQVDLVWNEEKQTQYLNSLLIAPCVLSLAIFMSTVNQESHKFTNTLLLPVTLCIHLSKKVNSVTE